MSTIGPKTYVSPGGNTKVRIYHHGFIEPVTEITNEDGETIQAASDIAMKILGPKATPFQIFEFMGWKEAE